MKGDKKVIQFLNKQLTIELSAINQYFLHARMYKNWGFDALGRHEYEESIEEMKHADKLIERILFLEGLPNMQNLGKLLIGENVPECLAGRPQAESDGRRATSSMPSPTASPARITCRARSSRRSSEDTEEHIDYLETQLELIEEGRRAELPAIADAQRKLTNRSMARCRCGGAAPDLITPLEP